MQNPQDPPPFPSADEMCIQWPLYSSYTVANTGVYRNRLHSFICSNYQLDTFCPDCANSTVLILGKYELNIPDFEFTLEDRIFHKRFICSRNHSHEFFFYFRLRGGILSKVGQSPSIADVQQGHIKHYRTVLEKPDYQELSRALGLASHGIGIGSYVYLRRIFERLVEEAHQAALSDSEWDEASYGKLRMEEKIAALKKHLPVFLVEQRGLYSILSIGIHSLKEEECLSYFPILRTGIELMLDEKLAMAEQKRKMNEATKQIALLQQSIKKT